MNNTDRLDLISFKRIFTMTGKTISHYKIQEKLPITSGQVGEGGMSQNHPRVIRRVVVILSIPMERSVLGRHEE